MTTQPNQSFKNHTAIKVLVVFEAIVLFILALAALNDVVKIF